MLFLHSFMGMFQMSVGELQREGTSVVEMPSIIFNVKTSIENRLASKFIPLKVKKLLSQMEEGGYEEECGKFHQQVAVLYSSCLNYLNMCVRQCEEISPLICMNLNSSLTWENFQLVMRYVVSKGVDPDDSKCFDDFWHLQKFVKENEIHQDVSSLLAHEKWALYFRSGINDANHPELLKIVQFCFAIPAHNGNIERVFSVMQSQWSKERNRLTPDSVASILIVQYNFKDMSCEQFHSHIKGIPELLKQIGSTEEYDWAQKKDL